MCSVHNTFCIEPHSAHMKKTRKKSTDQREWEPVIIYCIVITAKWWISVMDFVVVVVDIMDCFYFVHRKCIEFCNTILSTAKNEALSGHSNRIRSFSFDKLVTPNTVCLVYAFNRWPFSCFIRGPLPRVDIWFICRRREERWMSLISFSMPVHRQYRLSLTLSSLWISLALSFFLHHATFIPLLENASTRCELPLSIKCVLKWVIPVQLIIYILISG